MNGGERFAGQTVVITGGSSGIGLAVALRFAAFGSRLVLLARDGERLGSAQRQIEQQVPRARVHTCSVDVADGAALSSVLRGIGDRSGIHTLINNAGGMLCGRFCDIDPMRSEAQLRANYSGMVHALHAAWPYLAAARDPHIGFVSSVAGCIGAIGYAGYAPGKFAVTGLAECIRMEARGIGAGVTIVFPPDTDTPLLAYERQHTLPETRQLSKNAGVLTAGQVAERFVRGIVQRRFEVFCTAESWLIRATKAVAPRLFYAALDGMVAKVSASPHAAMRSR